MGKTVADFVVRRLHDRGIRIVYGCPGDGIDGLMGALGRFAESTMRLVHRYG